MLNPVKQLARFVMIQLVLHVSCFTACSMTFSSC